MSDKELIINRIRQLLAVDRNAALIYTELAKMTKDEAVKGQLQQIARDEGSHVATSLRLLKLLGAA